ncbi:hypothetical protein ABIF42_000429 [Bradyrhizobium diazoefficiens]
MACNCSGISADLVEKQRAPVGDPEFAVATLAVRAGIGARRGAEELRFDQRIRDRRDVDADERLFGAGGGVVDGLRQHLLAGAGLPGEQNGDALARGARCKLLGLCDAGGCADIVVESEPGGARMRQLPPRQPQVVLELGDATEQWLQALEAVVKHEADRADDIPLLVLDRHAGHDELLAAELHDVEDDRFTRLHDPAHQAVGDDLLDRAAERLGFMREAHRGDVFLVDIHHASAAIDRDGALAQMLQPLEQRLHGACADIGGIADDRRGTGHGVPRGKPACLLPKGQ